MECSCSYGVATGIATLDGVSEHSNNFWKAVFEAWLEKQNMGCTAHTHTHTKVISFECWGSEKSRFLEEKIKQVWCNPGKTCACKLISVYIGTNVCTLDVIIMSAPKVKGPPKNAFLHQEVLEDVGDTGGGLLTHKQSLFI